MSINIQIITKANEDAINIKNEPFELFGRLIPKYDGEKWTYDVEKFEKIKTMCFPDESYNFDEINQDSVCLGAFDGDKCIGLGIFKEGFFKYMYLYDFKVDQAYRGKGIGEELIKEAQKIAQEKDYIGIYTQGQDNNLGACLFYLKTGFKIGGLDTKVYNGTSQADKKDIIFYLDFNE